MRPRKQLGLTDRSSGVREILGGRITATLGDIRHLTAEIARLKREKPPQFKVPAARRRPKSITTLQTEIDAFDAYRAWLHVQLIELRGDKVFSGEIEKLVASGLVAAPGKPVVQKRGRPSRRIISENLFIFTTAVQAMYADRGIRITTREAVKLASEIISKRRGRLFIGREQDYYTERRRRQQKKN
jgi:hypothetical protein